MEEVKYENICIPVTVLNQGNLDSGKFSCNGRKMKKKKKKLKTVSRLSGLSQSKLNSSLSSAQYTPFFGLYSLSPYNKPTTGIPLMLCC